MERFMVGVRSRLSRLRGELNGTNRRRDLRRLERRLAELVDGSVLERQKQQHRADATELEALRRATEAWKNGPVRDDRINGHLLGYLHQLGVAGGEVLEIGGREHPRRHVFDASRFRYRNLDLEPGEDTVVADITDCPELEDGSFDVIVSVDVFEHITEPWKAAAEISRLLAPGGMVYTSTLFSWRYHPCPIDYWRYTPEALAFLFDELTTVDKGFDDTERRRDMRRKSKEDPLPIDEFGGWRENVRVFHVGAKPR
jgi:SAM-dependent methyltransferase